MSSALFKTITESLDDLETAYDNLQEENEKLEKEVEELKEDAEEHEGLNEIKSLQPIYWDAGNFQDILTMEELAKAIVKHGSLKTMKHLEKMGNN